MRIAEFRNNCWNRIVTVKTVTIFVVLVLVATTCLLFFAKPLSTPLIKMFMRHRLSSLAYHFEDGLHVGICGSGSPLVDINRTGPCIAVVAGKHLYVVDIGDGSTRNITLMGFQTGKIDAVLLTHFHSDHIAGLGEVMLQRWAGGSKTRPVKEDPS